MSKLTQKRLKELLEYNPKTGIFTWLKPKQKVRKCLIAGGICKKTGYRHVGVDGKPYPASRLAWFYMEGYWPENLIDHENRIRDDNRWINLRHVSRVCNVINCGISKRNKSGVIGVSWNKNTNKWESQIQVSGKKIHLGHFVEKVDAVKVRWKAEKEYKFPNCNTTSTAFLYLKSKNA